MPLPFLFSPYYCDYGDALDALKPHITATLSNKLDPSRIWDKAIDGTQHQIMNELNDSLRQNLVAGLPAGSSLSDRGVRITVLGQNTPEAGAWITANPLNARCKMSNGSVTEAVRKRLLIPLMAYLPGQACAACAAPLETQGTHSTCCRAIDKSNRHKQMQAAVSAVVREASTLFVRTPPIETYWPLLPQPPYLHLNNTYVAATNSFAGARTGWHMTGIWRRDMGLFS